MTSPDGISWTGRDSPAYVSWNSVVWGGPAGAQLFVAVASGGTGTSSSGLDRVMTSTDGITWTKRNAAAENIWFNVIWGGPSGAELFVAVSITGTGNRVMTSLDGISWTARVSTANYAWRGLAWGGPSGAKVFAAVAASGTGDRVMTSTDGVTWTTQTSAFDSNWFSVIWAGPAGQEIFVAVASYTSVAASTGKLVMT